MPGYQPINMATSALGSQDPRLDPESSIEDDLQHIGTSEVDDPDISQSETFVRKGSGSRTKKSLKRKVTPPTSYFNPWVLQPQQLRQKLENLQQEQVVGVDQVQKVEGGEYDELHPHTKGEIVVVDVFDDSKEVSSGDIVKTTRKMPQECVTEDMANGSVSVNNSNMDASYVGEQSLADDVACDVTNMNQTKDTRDARHEIADNYARTTNNNRTPLSPQAKEFVSKVNRTGAIGKRRSQALMPEDQLNAYRQRKKSLALAMNEGRLEMKEVAMRPLDIETDFHLIAQLNQLNRELMDLSRSGSSTSPSSPGPNTNQTAFSVAEQSPEIALTEEDTRTNSRPSSPLSPLTTTVTKTKRSSYNEAVSPISPRKLKGSLQMDIPGKSWKQSNEETAKGRKTGDAVTTNSANSSKKSSPEQKGNSENGKNTKESKSTSPRDVLSRIKVRLSNNKFSRNSPQRSSAGKVEIQILRPNVESVETRLSNVSLRRAASLKHDPDSRKTWPSMEASTEGTCESENLTHVATDPGQVSKYQRNNSVGPVERQRKRPVLPDENVSYLQALEQSQHAPGSSTDSGLGKDHRHSKSSADSLLEDMPLDLSSPVSSQGNSNPPSRPLSSDCGDLQWERGLDSLASRRSREYQRFLSQSMPQSPTPLTPSLGSHEDLLDRPFSTPGSHEDLLAGTTRGEGTRASGSSQGSSIGQAAVQMRAKPPKPRHRPARRSKTDLGDPKIIKAALTLAKLQAGEESTKVERRRSSSGRKRPTSALGIMGMLNSTSNDRESPARQLAHPEGKLSPPALRLSLTPTQESMTLDIVGDDYPAEMPLTPKRRSQSLGSTGIDLSQLGLLKRSLSLPCGLGSEDEMVSDPDLTKIKARMSENFEQCFAPTLAEALFDHVTMDAGELTFQAGDMIEITDMADSYWWWGCIDKQEGWLPAPFVRLRVSQGETVEECISRLSQENSSAAMPGGVKPSHEPLIRKVSLSFLSNDQVRANVIREIITTERDYVKNLADICVGYIEQAHSRPDMFSPPLLQKLFCNIEEIFSFQKQFLADLETCIDDRMPHLSSIGACFLKRKAEFEIYGEYCNNYPHAINELKDLMKDNKYVQFFEACRLLQSMIKISLDGFLLTPVQKICKYPLQLNELLKYTRPQHPDFRPLEGALDAMRDVAQSINERKRRIEHIENIAVWQKTIGDWEGDDVLERSAMLIYSDEVNRVSLTGRHRTSPRQLFLFDHQLIICRKDILRRDLYLYKDRIDLDDCQIEDLPDGKENEWNVTLRYAWKIQNFDDQPKVYVFMCRSRKEKRRWLRHFAKERKIVHDGLTRGSSFMAAKEAALRTTSGATKPSKPSDRATVRRALSMPQRKIREQLRDANLQLPRQSTPDVYADLTPKRKGRSLFGFQVGKK